MPLAERLKQFVEIWKILTKDLEILEHVEGYQIPFNKNQGHQKIPETPHMNLDQRHQVQVETDNMLEKGAICKTSHLKEESSQWGRGTGVTDLNQVIPYQHFKMESSFCLRKMLQKDGFMCKLDMKDTYFSLPLHQSSRKQARMLWSRSIYEFLWPCFGFWLGPSTSNIYKTFKKSLYQH